MFVLLDKLLNIPHIKSHRAVISQTDARQLSPSYQTPNRVVGHGQEFLYFRNAE